MKLPVRRLAFVALLVASAPFGAAVAESDAQLLERLEREVVESRKRLPLVRQYAERGEIAALERAEQAFSEAETQFLLDNFEGCAALLLDVVEMREFQSSPKYPQALYYLAESFFRADALLESLRYYRLALPKLPPGKIYQDSVIRLLDLSDRTGDYADVDRYFESSGHGGTVRPEVTYLYARWLSHRRDLKPDVRFARADAEFARVPETQPLQAQALFFRGALRVAEVQRLQAEYTTRERREPPGRVTPEMAALKQQYEARLEEAAAFERQVLALPEPSKPEPKMRKARDLANLALARILYEQGKINEATDRYNEVARDSDDYNDALFETAAAYVKMGNYEQALRTSDILLIIGKDSMVLPQAKILQANLHLKLGQYDKASASFADVVNDYGPVYDQIKALLQKPDPVAHFDELIRRSGQKFDIATVLPAQARAFVKLDKQVEEARIIAAELEMSRRGIDESSALAKRLLDTLASGRLQIFPQLQEGNSLAIEQSNRLGSLEGELVKLQLRLLGDAVPADIRDGLAKLDEERRGLDARFQNLPKNQEAYADRKAAYLKRIGELDKLAFELANKVSELRANLVGLQIYWRSTRDQRKVDPTRETERQAEFEQTTTLVEQLDEQRRKVVQQIELERATVSSQASGGDIEEELRARYHKQLAATQALIEKALPFVGAQNRPLLQRVQAARTDVDGLQAELTALRARIRERALAKAEEYRREVIQHQTTLEAYQRDSSVVEGRSGRLLGEIAVDSFKRVSRQFYDLVLKADVGVIDVAWARKKDRTDHITGLGRDREGEIQRLRERFKEVLNDAD